MTQVSLIASSLARLILERHLQNGGTVKIPSLAIEFDKNGAKSTQGKRREMVKTPERTSTVYWFSPSDRAPAGLQTILVKWGGIVRAGVYCKGEVGLYPEDFGKVKLSECERWASLPE